MYTLAKDRLQLRGQKMKSVGKNSLANPVKNRKYFQAQNTVKVNSIKRR